METKAFNNKLGNALLQFESYIVGSGVTSQTE